MNKTIKIYGIILAAVLVLFTFLELGKTELVNWNKNYDIKQKSPFGLYVFSKEAPALLQNKIEKVNVSPYEYYQQKRGKHNILLIQPELDKESWKKILKQSEEGAEVLVFSETLDYLPISDSLDISTYRIDFENFEETDDKVTLYFTDTKLESDSIVVDKLPNDLAIDSIRNGSQVLGYAASDGTIAGANFIKVKHGKGNFYFHTEPLVLTNYYLLQKENVSYITDLLSYLPDNVPTVWFVKKDMVGVSQSEMRFILSNPPLKYAWWLFLAGIVLFIFFNAKRRQRIIPIIPPKQNKSVEFVKSIGNLYLNEGDSRDMMVKKAQYFLHRVRMELLIDTQNLDEEFINKLHLKTGKSIEKITEAVDFIKKSQQSQFIISNRDLIKMNKILDEIY